MSTYNEEAGTLTLRQQDHRDVKTATITAAVKHNDAIYAASQHIWNRIPVAARRSSWRYQAWVQTLLWGWEPWRTTPPAGQRATSLPDSTTTPINIDQDIKDELSFYLDVAGSDNATPRRLLRSQLPQINSRTRQLDYGDFTISFNNTNSTLHWYVGENNHAVEAAHQHPVAKALFTAIGRIRWTRNYGGTFYGNDEYNKEAGGGQYVTATWGNP